MAVEPEAPVMAVEPEAPEAPVTAVEPEAPEAPVTAVEPEAQVAKAPLEAPAPKAKAKGRPRGSKDKQARKPRINLVPAEQAEPEQMTLDNFPQELPQPVSHVDFDIGNLMWTHLQALQQKRREEQMARWRSFVA